MELFINQYSSFSTGSVMSNQRVLTFMGNITVRLTCLDSTNQVNLSLNNITKATESIHIKQEVSPEREYYLDKCLVCKIKTLSAEKQLSFLTSVPSGGQLHRPRISRPSRRWGPCQCSDRTGWCFLGKCLSGDREYFPLVTLTVKLQHSEINWIYRHINGAGHQAR